MGTISSDQSQRLNWTVRKKTDATLTVTVTQSSSAFNLTTYTFIAEIFPFGSSTPILTLTEGAGITNGHASGIVTLALTDTQLTIPADDYFWTLRTTAPNDNFWFNGQFTVNGQLFDDATTSSAALSISLTTPNVSTTITLAGGSSSSGGGSSLARTTVKTGPYTAVANDLVPVDTTSGSVTITLPAAPTDKAQVIIKHIIQGSTNTVTINRGGSDVFNKTGGGTSLTLTLLNQAVWLQYDSANAIWTVLADDLALSQLDNRFQTALGYLLTKILSPGDYTLILTDVNKILISDSASAINIIIPPFASVAWPPYVSLQIYQRGAGQVTITYSAPITLNSSNSASNAIPARYSSAMLELFEVQDVWQLSNGTAAGGASDATITFSDIATNNASTSMHGFMPKLSNSATTYYNSQGGQTVPPGAATDVNISTSDVTNNNLSTSKHGFAPKAPNDLQQALLGDGNFGAFRYIQNAFGSTNDRYITGAINGTSPNTAAAVANTLRAYPIIINFKTTIDKMIMEVTTGTTGNIRFGIYDSNSVGYPNARQVDAGAVAISAPAVLSVSGLSAVLVPGMYFLVYLTDTANTFRAHQLAAMNPLMGTSIAMGVVVGVGWTVALTYAALPSTFTAGGTVMTTGTPIIGVRMT